MTNTILDPRGTAVAGVTVTARLRPGPGFRISDSSEVAGQIAGVTDARGVVTLTLEQNANINPAGSYWEWEEATPELAGGRKVYAAVMGPADATLVASLVSAPQPQADGLLTQTAGDARYQSRDTLGDGVRYVRATGSDGADGLSWVTAKATIGAAVAALGGLGGLVLVGAGTFTIGASITLPSNTTLRGVGPATVLSVPRAIAGGPHRAALELFGGANVVIEDLAFDVAAANAAISGFAYSNLTIQRCLFTGPGASGTAMVNLSSHDAGSRDGARVLDCRFVDCTGMYGVQLWTLAGRPITDTLIAGCHFERVLYAAVKFTATDGIVRNTAVVNCTFIDIIGGAAGGGGPYGAAVTGGDDLAYQVFDVLIAGCYCRNGRAGERHLFVNVYATTNLKVLDNTAIETAGVSDSTFLAPGRLAFPDIDVLVLDNYVEGWGSFWDPDSMRFVEVAGNIVRNCSPNGGLALGYGVQEYVNIHDNVFYNSISTALPAAIVIGNVTSCKACTIHDNLIIDDRNPPTMAYGVETTGAGAFDSSQVTIVRNRIVVPNVPFNNLQWLFKQNAANIVPRVMERNEVQQAPGGSYAYQQVETTQAIAVGASPFTYTNPGPYPQVVYIFGGLVTNISTNDLQVSNAVPCTVVLQPGRVVTVAYGVAPTMRAEKLG
jgi:hypothetical protein